MTPKPIIHGFDHAKGGADPVPGLGGIQFHDGTYGADNSGDWLQVETTGPTPGAVATTGAGSYSGLGIAFVDSSDGGIVIGTSTDANVSIDSGGGNITLTSIDGIVQLLDSAGAPGTGVLYVSFGSGMNFTGGYTTWSVDGFEVDSGVGIYLNNGSADGININQTGGNTAGHDVDIHADHTVVITAGNDLNMTASASVLLRAVGASGMSILADDAPIIINALGGVTEASVQVRMSSGNYFSVQDTGSHEILRVTSAGTAAGSIMMPDLPTSSPGIAGQLWRSGGTVMVV